MDVSSGRPAALRRLARGARARVRTAFRRAGRVVGVEPHRASEDRGYWEQRASRYKAEVLSIFDPADPYYRAQQEFLAVLGAEPWTSIVEIGCGFGWHAGAIRGTFPDRRCVGLDFSATQLREARVHTRGTVPLVQASATALPFADGAFDVVFTSGLLVCIHPEAVAAVMRELARVARRTVMTLEYAREHVATPAARAAMDGAAWHGHRFGALFAAADLDVVRAAPFAAFAAEPDRVPLSLFHGRKRAS